MHASVRMCVCFCVCVLAWVTTCTMSCFFQLFFSSIDKSYCSQRIMLAIIVNSCFVVAFSCEGHFAEVTSEHAPVVQWTDGVQ